MQESIERDAGILSEALALLDSYYKPLIGIEDEGDIRWENGLLAEPLWCHRQITLQEQGIDKGLKRLAASVVSTDSDIDLLVCLTDRCQSFQQPIETFSGLLAEEQNRLLRMAEEASTLQPMVVSLLVTLLLRDPAVDYRKTAIELLKWGECERSIVRRDTAYDRSKKIKLMLERNDLLRTSYIELSHINLTGLEAKLNFSGLNLTGLQGSNTDLRGCSFRYACLSGASLNNAILKHCDLTGVNLWKVQLSGADLREGLFDKTHAESIHLIGAKAQKSRWRQANLCNARMESSHFDEANCCAADMSGAVLKDADFSQVKLMQVSGLTVAMLQTVSRLQACECEAEMFSHTDMQLLGDALFQKEKGLVRFIAQKPTDLSAAVEQLSANCIRRECYAYEGPSPLWPKEENRWKNESYWHGEKKVAMLCDLEPNDALYTVLENFIHLTSDTMTYQSRRFEVARLKKAFEAGQLSSFIQQEIQQPPVHRGRYLEWLEVDDLMVRWENLDPAVTRNIHVCCEFLNGGKHQNEIQWGEANQIYCKDTQTLQSFLLILASPRISQWHWTQIPLECLQDEEWQNKMKRVTGNANLFDGVVVRNCGEFFIQQIVKRTFMFFDPKTLKTVGCVSKGFYALQKEAESEQSVRGGFQMR